MSFFSKQQDLVCEDRAHSLD